MLKSVKFLFGNVFCWRNRKGIAVEALMWIIISIAVLAILMLVIFVLRGQGESIIDRIKGLFRS
jgi:hypothetical protein